MRSVKQLDADLEELGARAAAELVASAIGTGLHTLAASAGAQLAKLEGVALAVSDADLAVLQLVGDALVGCPKEKSGERGTNPSHRPDRRSRILVGAQQKSRTKAWDV